MHIKDENGIPVPHVFHNTPMKLNKFGGNVVLETLEQFEKDGREIIEVQKSNIDLKKITKKNEVIKKRKFDWADFNCEHYVSFVSNGEMKSSQMGKYVFVATVAITTMAIIKIVRNTRRKKLN